MHLAMVSNPHDASGLGLKSLDVSNLGFKIANESRHGFRFA
jgi:hypothetical protein